jgi:hypothetical protein
VLDSNCPPPAGLPGSIRRLTGARFLRLPAAHPEVLAAAEVLAPDVAVARACDVGFGVDLGVGVEVTS